MKQYTFELQGLKPLSVNDSLTVGKKGAYKSDKYRIFEAEFDTLLDEYDSQIEEIKAQFSEKKCLHVDFRFYYPFETKSGRVGKRKGDVTNGLKACEDCLTRRLEIDDAFVIGGSFLKVHSANLKIVIDLWVKDYVRI